MRAEIVDVAGKTESLLSRKLDCLWLVLSTRSSGEPIQGSAIQQVDWKLQGLVSRFLFEDPGHSNQTTFVPTMKRLNSSYIAIDCQRSIDIDSFLSNIEGLKLSEVLCLCEEEEQLDQLKKALGKVKSVDYPKKVYLALDTSPSKGSA